MSSAEQVARALNLWASDGLDLVGGADREALDGLVADYFDLGSQEPDMDGCKTSTTLPLHESFNFVL